MKSNYKRLGDYIKPVKEKNTSLKAVKLLGINIDKFFMPSVANVTGTDMSNYKIVKKGQFACNRMHVGRDYRIPIALSKEDIPFMVSPAYDVFEIIDTKVLLPEYLMMWFSRKEFDRNTWFHTDADVRGGLPWSAFCNLELPIPNLEKQQELVREYNTIQNRIALNNQLISKLEETAQAIYKQWFVDFEFPHNLCHAELVSASTSSTLGYKSAGGKMVWCEELEKEIPEGWENVNLSSIVEIKDGTHDSPKPVEFGLPLVTSTHLNSYDISLKDTYNISEEDFNQTNKRSKVDKFDILFSMIGTVGIVNYVLYSEINFAIKNVGLFKTSKKKEIAEYILFYLKSDYMKQYLASNPNGSTQNYVTLGFLRTMPIIIPKDNVLYKFEELIKKLIDFIHLKTSENQKLEELKDLLLAKMTRVESKLEIK
ncbi:restriction endonuclease subunit S [Flavobacterium sp.]|uniref:restriction endonuclease subunit S n=1 Tax=Flavobacterium sp. TaxID=239 RepID=UPI0035ADD9A2